VEQLLPWDDPDLAPLWSDDATPLPAGLRERLRVYGAAIVYSREPILPRRLSEGISRVESCPPLPPPDFAGHASLWACGPVERFGGAPSPPEPPRLRPPRDAEPTTSGLVRRLGSGFVAVHPGSGSPRKNWPPERFHEVGRVLSAGRPWLVTLGPAEGALRFPHAAGDGCVCAAALSLPALASLLSRAGLYVGNDSGVTHLAAALGIPTLALFGPTQPSTWGPLGERARTLRSPSERMEDLEVAAVLLAAGEMKGAASGLQV